MNRKTKKRLIRIALGIAVGLVLVTGGFYLYTLDYYRADDTALEAMKSDTVSIKQQDNLIVFTPQGTGETGLIFYPGGKVDPVAYAPLLTSLARRGITCILIKMPMNLAVFNINAADGVYDRFPDIGIWYIGGHSLGGAMASSYVDKNSGRLEGLILLGAYPIDSAGLPTLAIYGSEDLGLDTDKLAGVDTVLEIPGGNHAYFGNYGEQKGDGTASITPLEQQQIAVAAILDFIGGSSSVPAH